MHERMMTAYFSENRDISSLPESRGLWIEVGLPEQAFESMQAPEIEALVRREFEEAQGLSATGVPGLRRADNEIIITGAQPEEVYRRWFEKSLADGIQTP